MSQNDRSPWPTITLLGVLCGLALGAIVILVIRGRRQHELEGGLELDSLLPPPPPRRPRPALPRARTRPVARSMVVSHTEPTVILKAVGQRDWSVQVRVVGPPGSSAQFMISNSPSDSILLEGGDRQEMHIPRDEFLYAQGNMPNVQVSVSGGEMV